MRRSRWHSAEFRSAIGSRSRPAQAGAAVGVAVAALVGGGQARLKAEIADRVQLDIETLPYHLELLAFLREQKAQGRC